MSNSQEEGKDSPLSELFDPEDLEDVPFLPKLKKSALQHPDDSPLVEVPELPVLDDTDRLALTGPSSLKTEQRVVTIMTSEQEIVPWYKQIFEGPLCPECNSKKSEEEDKKIISEAYCTTCYQTDILDGYRSYRHVRLNDVYIEWGGIPKPFPSGRLEASVDFEYHITPGDFFELGKLQGDVVFKADTAAGERRDETAEGVPCLWRVLDVRVVMGEHDFPLAWGIICKSVETFEPVFGWLRDNPE